MLLAGPHDHPSVINPDCLFGRGRRELLRGQTATSFPNQGTSRLLSAARLRSVMAMLLIKTLKGRNTDNTNYTVKRIIIDTVAARPTVKHIKVQRRGNDIAEQQSELPE